MIQTDIDNEKWSATNWKYRQPNTDRHSYRTHTLFIHTKFGALSHTHFTYDLFLCVLVGAEQVDSLHVSKVDVMSQQEDEEQLADILLLTIAIQCLIPLELGADVGQLLIDPLDLCLLALTWGRSAALLDWINVLILYCHTNQRCKELDLMRLLKKGTKRYTYTYQGSTFRYIYLLSNERQTYHTSQSNTKSWITY